MQQIVLRREFSVLFDAIKTVKMQYLEETIQTIKKNFIEKNIYHKFEI